VHCWQPTEAADAHFAAAVSGIVSIAGGIMATLTNESTKVMDAAKAGRVF
jgi:hypothetical protein